VSFLSATSHLRWVRTWSADSIVSWGSGFVRVHADPVARGEGMSLDRDFGLTVSCPLHYRHREFDVQLHLRPWRDGPSRPTTAPLGASLLQALSRSLAHLDERLQGARFSDVQVVGIRQLPSREFIVLTCRPVMKDVADSPTLAIRLERDPYPARHPPAACRLIETKASRGSARLLRGAGQVARRPAPSAGSSDRR
jgi:hypothetical protein